MLQPEVGPGQVSLAARAKLSAPKFASDRLKLNRKDFVNFTAQHIPAKLPDAEPRSAMPFLDADALKVDPAGIAFLRSVIEPASEADRPAETTPGPGPWLRTAARKPQGRSVLYVRDRRVRAQARV